MVNHDLKLERREVRNEGLYRVKQCKNQRVMTPNRVKNYWHWHPCCKEYRKDSKCAEKVACLKLRSQRGAVTGDHEAREDMEVALEVG